MDFISLAQGVGGQKDTEEQFAKCLDQLGDGRGQHLLISLEIAAKRAGYADKEQGRGGSQDTVHGGIGFQHVLRVRLSTDHHDTHAHKAYHDKQKESDAEYPLRLADLPLGTALRQHHGQRHRQAVGGDHEEAGVQRIGMGIVAHTRITYDMVHRNLEQKSDGFNNQIGDGQHQHTGEKQFGTVLHRRCSIRLRFISQNAILPEKNNYPRNS